MIGALTSDIAQRQILHRAYGAFALLAVIGGFGFVLIKVGIETLPPTVLVLVLDSSAVLTLGALFAIKRRHPAPRGTRGRLPGYLLMAASNTVTFLAFGWGEQYISSGLTAILTATAPLWTAIFAYWVTPNERPSALNYAGVALGFTGTLILISPHLVGGLLRLDALASLAVLGGAASIASSALGQRRLLAGVDPLDCSLWQWVIATAIMVPIAAPSLNHLHPSLLSVAATITLGAVGSGLASLLFFFILNSLGATRGSSVIFLIPITAVLWGALLFQESLTVLLAIGMAVVLVGVVLTMVQRATFGSQ